MIRWGIERTIPNEIKGTYDEEEKLYLGLRVSKERRPGRSVLVDGSGGDFSQNRRLGIAVVDVAKSLRDCQSVPKGVYSSYTHLGLNPTRR